MSKYKVKFWCDSGANAFSCNTETVDLVDDWDYTEEEAKEIFESEEKQDVYKRQVSIWDNEKQQWISKEDTGTESNAEREKGLASDSFKRACVNWGIGRELYTSPEIRIFLRKNPEIDKFTKYKVYHLKTENGKIKELGIKAIFNFGTEEKIVFRWKEKESETDE